MAEFTFGDVNLRLRRKFGDDFGGRFSDDDVVRWINDAVREVVLANNLLQKTANIPLVGGDFQYDMPDDIMLLHSITSRGVALTGMGFKEFMNYTRDADSQATGMPQLFTVWAGKIRVYPFPAQTPTPTENLQVFYTYLPDAVTGSSDAEVMPLPNIYQNRVLEYCQAQASEMDEDREGYALKMQEFQVGVSNTKDEIDNQIRDEYPVISVSPEDYGGHGFYQPGSYDNWGW